ncbi:hypothetical protein RY27_13475 [Litorilinea aerophila]|nr:hypothetical protein RY27_13475 [Litorilinea aerophila]
MTSFRPAPRWCAARWTGWSRRAGRERPRNWPHVVPASHSPAGSAQGLRSPHPRGRHPGRAAQPGAPPAPGDRRRGRHLLRRGCRRGGGLPGPQRRR